MRFGWGVAAIGVLWACGLFHAARADQIGRAASVIPSADYTRGTVVRTLTIDEALEQDDRIRTSQDGSIQVRFLDDTLLTIGPNSEVLLDKFVFEGPKAKNLSIEVVRGAMRFVSGTSDRSAYQIKTPVANIGVRGTILDVGYVNNHWVHNTIDGAITGCLRGTSTCRDFSAGELAFSVGPSGFVSISPGEAKQLFRNLDQTHFSLAKAGGHDPTAPSGAAAGNGATGSTGSTGSGGSSTSSGEIGSTSPPGTGQSGGPTNPGVDPGIGQIGCTANCSPPPPPPPCTTAACLGVVPTTGTGTGPAFPASVTIFRITGAGGPDSGNGGPPDLDDPIVKSNNLFAIRSSATWDNSTDLRSITVQRTPDASDPFAVTFNRTTAQIIGNQGAPGGYVGVDGNGVPVYYLASFTNGGLGFTASDGSSGNFTLGSNQLFSILAWSWSGSLFSSPQDFGGTVLFNLQAWTRPAWSDGHAPPGTFSGQLAVAVGTAAIRFGMVGTVVMPTVGTFSFSTPGTPGGIAMPQQSDAISPLVGDLAGFRAQSQGPATGPTSSCNGGVCSAEMHFSVIGPGQVGVTYFIRNGNNFGGGGPEIQGIATFAQSSSLTPQSGSAFVSFADPTNAVLAKGDASGTLAIGGTFTTLNEVHLSENSVNYVRIRDTASSVDVGGVPGIIGWERWAGGTYRASSDGGATFTSLTLGANDGIHFIHGSLTDVATLPTSWNAGASVQYSLVGGTRPTMLGGGVTPGTLMPDSKLGVNFSTMTVGVDLGVLIGGGSYRITTSGGAANVGAGALPLSGALFGSSGQGLSVTVNSTLCSAGCTAAVTGFLAGNGTDIFNSGPNPVGEAPPYIGLNYTFSTSSTPQVSGAAAFGRDLPLIQVAAATYIDAGGVDQLANVTLPAHANGTTAGVPVTADTPTGLAVQSLNFDLNSSSVNVQRQSSTTAPTVPAATVVEQGSISSILGWERWTSGNVRKCDQGGNCSDNTLTANQGVHLVYGTPATNIPTTGSYVYNLVGATKPTVANGSVAPGTLSGNMQVAFGASPTVTANITVDMQSGGIYTVHNDGTGNNAPMKLLGAQFNSNGFTIPTNSGALCPAPCTASLGGFLAGPGAPALGLFYTIGNMNTSAQTAISGVAGFKR